ncbi:MAG: helix-turn-helix domain-containing protein [Oscillospiraceae bacterium]|nr:helix-turn-helix domain-containing protein [Oscillospiraceae bacterium]
MKLSIIRDISKRFSPPTTPEELHSIQQILREEGIDFLNFYQELEMSDPYVETHRDVSFSNAQLSLHSHTFYELLYCINDCGAEYLVGADRYRLQKGDIVFVPPGTSHRPLLPENMAEPYQRYVLWLSQEFMELFAEKFAAEDQKIPYSALLRTSNTKWELLGGYFRRGVWEAEHQAPGWQAAVFGNTITLLTLMGRSIQERTASVLKAEKPDLLNEVLSYIELHLNEKITLEETAKHFYVSVSTITQLFRQKMGTSFYRCVTQRRLIAAKVRIGDGESLEDVSRAVGFSDYSSFYRAFKKEYGITPRQYTQL